MVTECEFTTIYSEYFPKIVRYLSRIVGPNDAEDTTQDVFNKVSCSLGGFKRKSKLSTWIYRIATNTAIDRVKSAPYKRSLESSSFSEASSVNTPVDCGSRRPSTADRVLFRKEMSTCINEYIDNLPLKYKTVLVLSELKSLSNQEIADVLGISLSNVKIRLHRARAKLKGALSNGCNFSHTDENILVCDRKSTQILPEMTTDDSIAPVLNRP